jgi:hypothetical protein
MIRDQTLRARQKLISELPIRCGRVRGLGEATSQEPLPRPARCTGRDGAASVGPQAHPELEL